MTEQMEMIIDRISSAWIEMNPLLFMPIGDRPVKSDPVLPISEIDDVIFIRKLHFIDAVNEINRPGLGDQFAVDDVQMEILPLLSIDDLIGFHGDNVVYRQFQLQISS